MRFVSFYHFLTCAKEEHIAELEALEKEREYETMPATGEHWL